MSNASLAALHLSLSSKSFSRAPLQQCVCSPPFSRNQPEEFPARPAAEHLYPVVVVCVVISSRSSRSSSRSSAGELPVPGNSAREIRCRASTAGAGARASSTQPRDPEQRLLSPSAPSLASPRSGPRRTPIPPLPSRRRGHVRRPE